MKNSLLHLIVLLASTLFLQSCTAGSDTVIIAGQVIESGSGNAIENAIVEVTQPENLQQTATTDSVGNFSFDVDPGSETMNVTLEISKQAYETKTTSFKVAPETNVDDLTIELQSTESSGGSGDGNNDDDVVEGESGEPAMLELVSISSSIIAIEGTGGNEQSKFVFAVKDTAGRPVGEDYEVNFSILKGPGGDEYIEPQTDLTNKDGLVQAAIVSGDSAGVVKIEAAINENVKSTPVLVAIGNGFPTSENFHIAPVNKNFEAFGVISNETVSDVEPNYIVASLGDYNHNPVLPGTAIGFETTAGNIDEAAITDEKGIAVVEIRPDGSRPNDHPDGIGFATVTAHTVDINDNKIEKYTTLLFTTPQAIITATNTNTGTTSSNISTGTSTSFNINNGGGAAFTYTVTDLNGYPMAAGTTITVEVGNGLTASGDVDVKVPDTFQGGGGVTQFGFSITDADPLIDEPASDIVTIVVTTPSGERSSLSISGSRAKTR